MNVSVGVSVIIPVYNKAQYLERIITQLSNQSFANLQLVFVNDGSTDDSLNIINRMKHTDCRIEIIDKENGGLVDAELAGIKVAEKEYIAFVDPDDKIGENYIINFINELDNDYDFVAQGVYFSANKKIEKVTLDKDEILTREDINRIRRSFLLQQKSSLPSRKIFHGRWNKLYKTSILKEVVADFSKCRDITLGEDTIFTYLFLKYAETGKITRKCNEYYYVQDNEDSMVHSPNVTTYLEQSELAFNRLSELMKANGETSDLPYALYFMLTQGLLNELASCNNEKDFRLAYGRLIRTKIFHETIRRMKRIESNLKRRLALSIEQIVKLPSIVWLIFSSYIRIK